MLGLPFAIALVLGSLLALPYALYAGRGPAPFPPFAAGLLVAAALYLLFAIVAGDGSAMLLELGGMLLFGALAVLGLRGPHAWLAVGWLAHAAWDVGLHPVEYSGYAPWWYPVVCIGFDFVVAGFLIALVAKGRIARAEDA